MWTITILLMILTAYTLSKLYNLYGNYIKARSIGLPLIFAPIDPYGILWRFAGPLLFSIIKNFPETGTWWCRFVNPPSTSPNPPTYIPHPLSNPSCSLY